jgi:hypothetical protein
MDKKWSRAEAETPRKHWKSGRATCPATNRDEQALRQLYGHI